MQAGASRFENQMTIDCEPNLLESEDAFCHTLLGSRDCVDNTFIAAFYKTGQRPLMVCFNPALSTIS